MLIPYKDLLPFIKEHHDMLHSWWGIFNLKHALSTRYGVSDGVINYRLENLKFEIFQHIAGVDIDDIDIYSHKDLKKNGFSVKSINDIQCDHLPTFIQSLNSKNNKALA